MLVGHRFAVIALAGLGHWAACAEVTVPPTDDAPFTSGSRLRARVFDAGGGARVLIDWQDTKLDVACQFRRAEDGELRCLPWDEEFVGNEPNRPHFTESDIFYLDSSCAQAVRLAPVGASPPKYVLGDSIDEVTCRYEDLRYPVYALAPDPVSLVGAELHQLTAEGCVPDGGTFDPGLLVAYPLGDRVAPSAFVGATRSVEPRGELAAVYLDADDGARQVVGLHDLSRDAECQYMGWAFAAEAPCLPLELAWSVGEFADASCATPAAYTSAFAPSGTAAGCAEPTVAVELPNPWCPGESATLYTLGAPISGPTYLVDAEGACIEVIGSDHRNFTLGPTRSPETFPLVRVTQQGTGRVRARRLAGDDGSPLLPVGEIFHDTATLQDCSPVEVCDGRTATGRLKCLPNLQSASRYFADAACTSELMLVWTPPCGGLTPEIVLLPSGTETGCLDAEAVREVGPQVSLTSVYQAGAPGECAPAILDQGAGFAYHELGPVVAQTIFADITVALD